MKERDQSCVCFWVLLRKTLKFGLFRIWGKLEVGPVVRTSKLLPTYHGVSVSSKVLAHEEVAQCV